MRPTLVLLATAASYVSARGLRCPQNLLEELIGRTSCGDDSSISKCLLSDINAGQLDEIEQCYIAGGCSQADAAAGALWFAHEYPKEIEEDERVELRRRADSSDTDSASETTTEKKTTAKTTAKSSTAKTTESSAAASSAAASSTAAPSSAAASTTVDSTTSDSTTSSSASTASSTTSTTSSTTTSSSSSTTSGSAVTTTGTLLCSTTNTVQTSMCSVSAGKTLSCVATTTAIGTCAAGNLCMTNSAGEDTCMKIDNTVGTAGIIIAVVFGTAISAIAVGLIIMNSKANRAVKRREAEHQALLSGFKGKGKRADLEAYAPQTSEANLPLIQEPGQQRYEGPDQGRRAPQLHQGLGALA